MALKLAIVSFLLITVSIAAVSGLTINNNKGIIATLSGETKNNTGNGNHFKWGELTESSILLQTYNVSTSNSYLNVNVGVDVFQRITFIEGIDQNQNGTGGYLDYASERGSEQRYVFLWFESNFNDGIDFLLRIYGEQLPNNNWSIGAVTPNSEILFIRRVYRNGISNQNVTSKVTFTYSGQPLITRIEANDLGGGRVAQVTWIRQEVTVFLESSALGNGISFEVIVYGERDDQQDFQIGSLNETSVLMFRQRVIVPASGNNQHVSSSVAVIHEPRHVNSMIQVLNVETDGTGSIVELHEDGLNSQYLVLWLRSTVVGLGIDVWVNVYGNSWENNFRRGQVTNNCSLLYTETIFTRLPENALALVEYVNQEGAIITMVQGRDLSYFGTGGRLSSLLYGVGTNNVTIFVENQFIDTQTNFLIEIYGY